MDVRSVWYTKPVPDKPAKTLSVVEDWICPVHSRPYVQLQAPHIKKANRVRNFTGDWMAKD